MVAWRRQIVILTAVFSAGELRFFGELNMRTGFNRMGKLVLLAACACALAGCQSSGTKVISASDDAAIQDALPKDVSVVGTISSIDVSDSVISIHFTGADKSGFYAVVLTRGRDGMEKAYGTGLSSLNGKTIRVTGKVTLYRNKPEIVINESTQVSVM